MSILNDLLNRVKGVQAGLQGGELPRLAVLPYGDRIVELQKEQLAEGKAASGEDLRPYYSEDIKPSGYFKSTATAANYAAWKQTINNPYEAGARNPDAPNLFITGKFYDEIGVEFGSDRARIVALTPFAAQVMAKYGADAFGLTFGRWMTIMWEHGGYERMLNEVKNILSNAT